MKFWLTYMNRNPFLAMAWLRVACYQNYGEVNL